VCPTIGTDSRAAGNPAARFQQLFETPAESDATYVRGAIPPDGKSVTVMIRVPEQTPGGGTRSPPVRRWELETGWLLEPRLEAGSPAFAMAMLDDAHLVRGIFNDLVAPSG
jgi:hypothetical protein